MAPAYQHKTNEQLQDEIFLLERQTAHIMEQVSGIKTELERRLTLGKQFYAVQVEEIKKREGGGSVDRGGR